MLYSSVNRDSKTFFFTTALISPPWKSDGTSPTTTEKYSIRDRYSYGENRLMPKSPLVLMRWSVSPKVRRSCAHKMCEEGQSLPCVYVCWINGGDDFFSNPNTKSCFVQVERMSFMFHMLRALSRIRRDILALVSSFARHTLAPWPFWGLPDNKWYRRTRQARPVQVDFLCCKSRSCDRESNAVFNMGWSSFDQMPQTKPTMFWQRIYRGLSLQYCWEPS